MNKHGLKSKKEVENMFDSSEVNFKTFSRKKTFLKRRKSGWKILVYDDGVNMADRNILSAKIKSPTPLIKTLRAIKGEYIRTRPIW